MLESHDKIIGIANDDNVALGMFSPPAMMSCPSLFSQLNPRIHLR
jgi:hypothetical protein